MLFVSLLRSAPHAKPPGGSRDAVCMACPVRLGAFKRTADGGHWVHMVRCCGRRGPLPAVQLAALTFCIAVHYEHAVQGGAAWLSCAPRRHRCKTISIPLVFGVLYNTNCTTVRQT